MNSDDLRRMKNLVKSIRNLSRGNESWIQDLADELITTTYYRASERGINPREWEEK